MFPSRYYFAAREMQIPPGILDVEVVACLSERVLPDTEKKSRRLLRKRQTERIKAFLQHLKESYYMPHSDEIQYPGRAWLYSLV